MSSSLAVHMSAQDAAPMSGPSSSGTSTFLHPLTQLPPRSLDRAVFEDDNDMTITTYPSVISQPGESSRAVQRRLLRSPSGDTR